MGHAPAVDVHARAVAINGSRELKVVEQVHDHALQFLNIAGDRAADSFQWKNGIARDLPRDVQHCAAAAAHPADGPAASVEFIRTETHVGTAPFAANRDAGRVIAHDHRPGRTIAADLVDEPALEGEESVEVNCAEQIGAQGPIGLLLIVTGIRVRHCQSARVLDFSLDHASLSRVPLLTQTDRSIAARLLRSPLILALFVTTANAAKPVLVDDTAYLTFARQIADHPLDPYGFVIHWYTFPEPAFEVLAPPVVPYWLAAGLRLFGEEIVLLKLWLLPLVWLFAWSVSALLRRFAGNTNLLPVIVLSPAVLPTVNLMLDIPALALGLAAVVVFASAVDRASWWRRRRARGSWRPWRCRPSTPCCSSPQSLAGTGYRMLAFDSPRSRSPPPCSSSRAGRGC